MTPPARFLQDHPIARVEDDRLDIARFVNRLVEPILFAPGGGGFVLGLYGPWGSGKSSALTLLETALQAVNEREGPDADDAPFTVVVRFTPWLYGGVETLLPAFFDTLASALGNMPGSHRKKRNKLVGAVRAMGEFVVPAVAMGGHLLGGPLAGDLAKKVAELVQGAAKGGAEMITATASDYDENRFRRQRDTAAKLLSEMKAGLRPVRVVMTIDDLDRASGIDEVLAMLKLVKLIADLPNVVYVIAMDRAHIEDLLSKHVSDRFGLEFLDKIVQVGLAVPAPEPERLSRWLIDEAREIAEGAGLDAQSIAVNWDDALAAYLPSNSFERLISTALRTPRDVIRILSLYRFGIVGDDGAAPPVHARDMLLITTLQVIAPRVYDAVRLNGRFLLHQDRTLQDHVADGGRERAERRALRQSRLDSIARGEVRSSTAGATRTDAAATDGRDATSTASALDTTIRGIVVELFPHAVTARGDGRDMREVRRLDQVDSDAHRISSPGWFSTYFRFAPPPDVAPLRLVDAVFAALCGREASADAGETGSAVPSTNDVPEWVTRVDAVFDGLSEAIGESLVDQIGNKIANTERAIGRVLAMRLPDLVQHSTTDLSDACEPWATHVVAVLTTYLAGGRGDRKTEDMVEVDRETAEAFLVAMVRAFASRDVPRAIDYAHSITNSSGYRALCPTPESLAEVARLGVSLGRDLLERDVDVFGSLGTRKAMETIWAHRRLMQRADVIVGNGRDEMLESYLKELVQRNPARVGDVLACATPWGIGETSVPFLEIHRCADAREGLAMLVDPEWFDAAVLASTNAKIDDADAVPLSHERVVRTYREFLDTRASQDGRPGPVVDVDDE